MARFCSYLKHRFKSVGVSWPCPCQASNKKGVQNRRFWLTAPRLPGSLVAGIAAGTLPSRFLSHQRFAQAKLNKNLDYPNFLLLLRAYAVCYTIYNRLCYPGYL